MVMRMVDVVKMMVMTMMMTEGSLGFDVGANGPTSRSAPA